MILNCDYNNLAFIFRILRYLFRAIKIVIPVILIIFAAIDMTKVVINADEKTKKEAGSKVVKRLIYAVILFLVPTLISLIFKAVDSNRVDDYKNSGSAYNNDWKSCITYIFE